VTSLAHRWQRSWSELGVSITPAIIRDFDELMFRYSEPHRKYHTVRHLEECFTKLAAVRALAPHPAEVEIALWFHDAIYERRADDNEARSARLAASTARAAGVASDSAERIRTLIMATRYGAVPRDDGAKVVVDADLAILGEAPGRFDEHEEQIRWEYSWVPGFLFKKRRMKALRQLLARRTIFSTQPFRERHENQARANIQRSLARLERSERWSDHQR
jgi:predicted metal-dependent HD superfamily phosphohydrolase